MLEHVVIKGYRGLKNLEVKNLSRVNLLVGKNNSGKTSVLEAIQLLTSNQFVHDLIHIASRRGEFTSVKTDRFQEIVDISHFFFGHSPGDNSQFEIQNITDDSMSVHVTLAIKQNRLQTTTTTTTPDPGYANEYREELLDGHDDTVAAGDEYKLTVHGRLGKKYDIPMITSYGLSSKFLRYRMSWEDNSTLPNIFVSTESLPNDTLAAMWDEIALSPAEEDVLAALRIIEPDIVRIAFLSGLNSRSNAGIVVKLRNQQSRIPLGSFGDGLRRILALAFAVVQSAGGVLLVDEIDTGLHYSVMEKMWEVIIKTAEKLDVQIFATTHSQDCLDGLANVIDRQEEMAHLISVQRIEADAEIAIHYAPQEILQASRRHIEVR